MKKILLVAFIAFMFTGCTKQPVSDTDFLLNTVSTITIYDMNTKKAEKLIDDTFSLCRDYEQMLSKTIAKSDISLINNAKGKSVEVSDETAALINKSIKYSDISNGKFDITIASASQLWDFAGENPHIPTDEELKWAAEKIDYKNIAVDKNMVTLKDSQSSIDLGGIAKGYIGDKSREFLIENGVKKAIINLGGNILLISPENEEKGFNIGIQKPFSKQGELYATINIKNGTVVTSGIYERCFEENGKIYHHILDTTTAYPVENNVLSVTIISNSSVDADALSTTCFALGVDEGLKLIESIENTEAVFITDDYNCHLSSGAEKIYNFKKIEQ